MAVLHTVTKANCGHLTILVTSPGNHGIGVSVVEHDATFCGHFLNILTELKDLGYPPLTVHDPTRAEGVPHTLVDAIFQRDLNVLFKCLQSTNPNDVDNYLAP